MGREGKHANYERVYEIMGEIMGFNLRKAGWNMHHEVFISDVKRNPELWGDIDVHGVENLFPLSRREHTRLHQMVSRGGIGRVALVPFLGKTEEVVDKRVVRKKPWKSNRQAVKTELKRYRGLSLADLDNLQVRGFIYS